MRLTLGASPCPNDCFVFDALVNRRIDLEGLEFDIHMATRLADSFTVVSSAPIDRSPRWRSTCTIHALSFPDDHETRHFNTPGLPDLRVQCSRESLGRHSDARTGNHEFLAFEDVDPAVSNGGHRRQRVPDPGI